MRITIRPTVKEDAAVLAAIQKEAFAKIYNTYRDAGNPYLRGAEDIVNRLMVNRFKYFTILANNEIVGGVFFRTRGSGLFFDELKENECYLQRIYLKPSIQGKRVASTALRMCESQFPGVDVFYVDFPEDLDQNRNCYEAVGFCDTEQRKEVEPGLVLAFYKKDLRTIKKVVI